MSEENGKVCCSCGHNIRADRDGRIECYCDVDYHYICYIECMTGWCRHWKRDKEDKQK